MKPLANTQTSFGRILKKPLNLIENRFHFTVTHQAFYPKHGPDSPPELSTSLLTKGHLAFAKTLILQSKDEDLPLRKKLIRKGFEANSKEELSMATLLESVHSLPG